MIQLSSRAWLAPLTLLVFVVSPGLLAMAAEPASAPGDPQQVYLELSRVTPNYRLRFPQRDHSSLIMREVLRQSLLIAARDEIGFVTGDRVLGEVPQISPNKRLEIQVADRSPAPVITVFQGEKRTGKAVWELKLDRDGHEAVGSLTTEIPFAEKLSRTHFVKALEKAGYRRAPRVKAEQPAAPLPQELDERISNDLAFDQQFQILRALHEEIATQGETPARLGGLVRVYTNLGILTEHFWHSMPVVFKARALLYAERMIAADPTSIQARWHRAYAHALIGSHREALRSLESARVLQANAEQPAAVPDWVLLLEPLCRYDFDALEKQRADNLLKPLSYLVSFLAYEQEGSQNLALAKGLEFEKTIPECYRMLDSLCEFSGVSAGHYTSQAGLVRLARTLPARLANDKQLPVHVQHILTESRAAKGIADDPAEFDLQAEVRYRAKLMAALKEVPLGEKTETIEHAEPGWPVLGQMIAETSFLQVFRRAAFERMQIGLPAEAFLTSFAPLVEDHPWAQALTPYRGEGWRQLELVPFRVQLTDSDGQLAMMAVTSRWPPEQAIHVRTAYEKITEPLANDVALGDRGEQSRFAPPAGLREYSPHSPYPIAKRLQVGDPIENLTHWESVAEKYPFLAQALAFRYEQEERLDDAIRLLQVVVKQDPSRENFYQLANIYRSQNKTDKWRETLEAFLKQPDFGLYHARARVDIAEFYCAQRAWDKALPYANAAATTGAQWALSAGWLVNEANQEWETAEAMLVAMIQRYRMSKVLWYYFCRRTNRGDLEAARQFVMPDGVAKLAPGPTISLFQVAIIQQLEGDLKASLASFELLQKNQQDSTLLMQIAVLADLLGDTEKRDLSLQAIIDAEANQKKVPGTNKPLRSLVPADGSGKPDPVIRPDVVKLAQVFIDDLKAGGKCGFELAKVDELIANAERRDHCALNHYLATYLSQHGHEQDGIERWKRCMGTADFEAASRTLAGHQLAQRNVEPKEWKQYMFAQPGK